MGRIALSALAFPHRTRSLPASARLRSHQPQEFSTASPWRGQGLVGGWQPPWRFAHPLLEQPCACGHLNAPNLRFFGHSQEDVKLVQLVQVR